MQQRQQRLRRRATAMSIVVALQAVAALFFLLDVAADLRADGMTNHLLVESAAALALLVAVVTGAVQVRDLLAAARQDELAVALARQAVAALVQQRLQDWQLTAAEADVALFAIKGCDAAEIARLRGSAEGTVRAQLTRIYAKAGVKSQSGLIALFLDDLIVAPVAAGPA
ncbi:helix-turn-helix transcriptional regulator [Sandarakinorhabdus oryzae]|uniref:helix-turn-helix transcriptional regulator n=1 Tax=Sandarakinorhabdus oryzae TaxID=2675220 RepID=UPI0012E26D02|nr:helix-turn-helix transcriptional regulator [Sandarakinorhabdus oryzae]